MKKFIALFVLLLVSAAVISAVAFSEDPYVEFTDKDLTIGGYGIERGTDYDIGTYDNEDKYGSEANNALIILSKKPMTVSGYSEKTERRIWIASPDGANLTFSDLTIILNTKVDGGNHSPAVGVADNVPFVNITLEGDNLLKSGPEHAGLENNSVKLTIDGEGKLESYGYDGGAGIGGGKDKDGEDITIKSGTIIAEGIGGAGIGGGENGSGITIKIGVEKESSKQVIPNCNVTAKGTNPNNDTNSPYYFGGGAGIGGGKNGSGSGITIYSGTVNATGMEGAGIGGGCDGNGTGITIKDGIVTAESTIAAKGFHKGGAGIGGGCGGNAADITISGGTVTANANVGGGGAGIGGGIFYVDEWVSNIYNQSVKHTHTHDATDISCKNITITGSACVEAKGTYYGAGIGGGMGGSCDTITIDLKPDDDDPNNTGRIIANASGGACIGGGSGGNGINITIKGSGTIIADGGNSGGAGIGGGANGEGDTINISGKVKVTATSISGAGIGGGTGGDGKYITIETDNPKIDKNGNLIDEDGNIISTPDAYVIATSINNGSAGIGGGNGANGSYITINSGYIEAKGQTGAGIGGGAVNMSFQSGVGMICEGGNGSDIVIKGGIIKAETNSGAGIGGGANNMDPSHSCSGSKIEITGGKIIATSKMNGAGIGGGTNGNAEGITITGNAQVTSAGGSTGIGGGHNQGGNVNVSGIEISGNAKVEATGGYGAGIGGYNVNNEQKVINGETVTVPGITITGNAEVTSTGYGGAGIGSSSGGSAEGIEISGDAKVTATGYGGAGIGSGPGGSCTDITISSGEITASGIGSGGLNPPGISGTTVIMGEDETSYPWIKTNGINGLTESESSDLAIVFDLDGKVGTVYGGTVQFTKGYTLGKTKELPCEKLIVPNGAKLVTNGLILNDGIVLYIEENATLDKYDNMTLNGGSKIQHEHSSVYVYNATERSQLRAATAQEWVCDICGKPEPHNWKAEWVNTDDDYHWHECDPGKDCSLSQNQLEVCSITENSQKAGYAEHRYDFNAPTYGADGKLHYFCKDCNHEYIADIPIIQLIKADGKGAPLEGAEFGLYSDEACTKLSTSVNPNASPTGTTAIENGKAVVSFAAELYKTYYIKEIKAPDDYTISNKVFKVFVDAEGNVTYGDDGSAEIPVCENKKSGTDDKPDPVDTPSSSIIKLIKVDSDTKNPLAGAQFGLYGDESCTELIMTGTTAIDADNNAVVSFTTELNDTYYIKEITAPEGYTASDKVYKAEAGADGKVTYSIVGSNSTSAAIPVCENKKTASETPSTPTIPTTPTNPTKPPRPSGTSGTVFGTVKIIKADGATGAPLANANFGLYGDEECTERILTRTTVIDSDNKAVVIFSIEPYKTYYIKETAAPDGYTVSDKVFTAVADSSGKVTYGTVGSSVTSEEIPVCKNYAAKVISDPVKIIKTDGTNGNPLVGAKFGLYIDENCTAQIAAAIAVIDANNKAVVTFNTEPSKTYYIKEIAAPDGYAVSDKVFKAVVDAEGKVTYGAAGSEITSKDIPICENEKTVIPLSSIKIIKVDSDTKNPLAGAQFGLYGNEECTELITTGTTAIDADNNAVVSFAAERNKTYYIKEIEAPDGYKLSNDVFMAVVDSDGKITYGAADSEITSKEIPICENEKTVIPLSSIKIIKVDSDTKNPLAGAQFGLYGDEECTELIVTGTTAIDAGNNAVVSFAVEWNNTYYIKEIEAPDGYKLSNDVFMAVVDADGKVTYGAVGSQITSEDILICENESADIDDKPVPDEENNPKTGIVFGIVRFVILNGVICIVFLAKGAQVRRKRKNSDDNEIDI